MKGEINLYNKYRPKCLNDFIGQTTIKNLLVQTFKKNKNPQAFIFYGSNGIGKTSLARILAKMANCPNFLKNEDVCNECKNCKLIEEFKTLDICEVDAASNSGVDNMREIIQNSHYVSLDLKKKIYIIDEAHNLSSTAWNSLLKTIEEPPSENIIFLFLTTNINKIPETILSRCQKYSFSKFKKDELFSLIEKISQKENKTIEDDAKHLISDLSQGSARECVTLLESIFLTSSDQITISDVERTFSLSNKQELLNLIKFLIDKDLVKVNNMVEEFFLLNKNLLNFFSELLAIFVDLYIFEKTENFSTLKKISPEEAKMFLGKNIDFLKIMEILWNYLNKYEHSNEKLNWSKILLFNIWESISGDHKVETQEIIESDVVNEKTEEEIEKPKLQKTIVEEKNKEEIKTKEQKKETSKEKEDFHINIEIPKISEEMENKIIYGLHSSNLNKHASLENCEHFNNFINSSKPSKELLDIFKKTKPIGNQILTTDQTVVIHFADEFDALLFNELMKRDDLQKELENFFLKKYEWIGVSKDQLKHYIKISKTKKPSDFPKFLFEKSEDKNIFNEVIKILEES